MIKSPPSRTLRLRKGFSLVELMVAATEGIIVVALVLGIFTASVVVGTSVGNYADMHERNKISISNFESDLRGAQRLTKTLTNELAAEVYQSFNPLSGMGTLATVTYKYDPGPVGQTKGVVTRNGVTVLSDIPNSGNATQPSCRFTYFDANDTPMTSGTPSKVLITATMRRTNMGRQNSDYLISAVVVLRTPQ